MNNISKKDNRQPPVVAKTDSSHIWRKRSLAVLISQALAMSATQAATITVNSTAATTGGPNCTLRDAITAAISDTATGGCSAGSGLDTIELGSNQTYTLTAVDNTTDGDNGLPDVSTQMTINGNGSTIERDGGAPDFRILHVSGGSSLTLNNVTIQNGNTSDNGGGIYNDEGVLTINNSTISGNTSDYDGGGIYNSYGKTTVNKSTISGNTSDSGGGIYHYEGAITVNNSTISGNTSDSYGGGIYAGYGAITINNSTISGNTSDSYGGGIYNYASVLTINNSTISGNTSDSSGGGIYNSGVLEISNSTISSNTSTSSGGGIYNEGTLTISNSTISGNTSTSSGGGIYNSSATILKNTIVVNNTASSGTECYNDDVLTANHYNLFGGDGTDCNAGATDLNLTTLGKTTAEVFNTTLADNGGATQTLALVAGSPAIDAGDDCPTTDQRGYNRVNGCDIGAFEYNGLRPLVFPPSSLRTEAISQTQIDLLWIDNSENETGFKVERNGSLITTTAASAMTASAMSFSDTGLTCGTGYTYSLRATTSSSGDSAVITVSGVTQACPPIEEKPVSRGLEPLPPTMGIFVQIQGSGEGTVSSFPDGLNCKSSHCQKVDDYKRNPTGTQCEPDYCTKRFDTTTHVKLTPVEEPGSVFTGWGGHRDCGDGELWMIGNKLCIAFFQKMRQLTVTTEGSGLIVNPYDNQSINIACGEGFGFKFDNCTAWYSSDNTTQLLAMPSNGYRFSGWSGNCNGTDNPLKVTMKKDKTCTAKFVVLP
jgi:uncharacterized repeat protein (TIGR02543 family)